MPGSINESVIIFVFALAMLVAFATIFFGGWVLLAVLIFVGAFLFVGSVFAGIGWLNRSRSSNEIRELTATLATKDSTIERLQNQLNESARTVEKLYSALSHSAQAVQRNTQANLNSARWEIMTKPVNTPADNGFSADEYFNPFILGDGEDDDDYDD